MKIQFISHGIRGSVSDHVKPGIQFCLILVHQKMWNEEKNI